MYRSRNDSKVTLNTASTTQPTIYIVDPDESSTRALADLAKARKLHVETFDSAEQFWDALPPVHCGCVVLEVDLPGMSGMMLQERLRNSGVSLPVVMLAGEADVAVAVQAMRKGAVDFLQKPWHPLGLWEAIQLALQRDSTFRQQEVTRAAIRASINTLTEDERLVMDLVLQGLPKKAIANHTDVSVRTIDVRRSCILRKMGVSSLIQLAQLLATVDHQQNSSRTFWGVTEDLS
jgi:FixJ family two-component response regulator